MKTKQISSLQKRKAKGFVLGFARWVFLLSLSYIVIFQLTYMVSYAIRPVSSAMDSSIVWVPKSITWENFTEAIETLEYFASLQNTLLICVVSALIEVVTCGIVAYGFARFKFAENKLVFFLVLITIVVPPQMILSPTFINYSHLDVLGILGLVAKWTGVDIRPNIIDTAWTFYLPSLFAVGIKSGLFIFIYRQFFLGLPKELEDAAYVDGAGPWRTFTSVIVPSSGTAVLTVTIFSLIWHWNDFYSATMFLSEKSPLSVQLSMMSTTTSVTDNAARNVRMAGCLLFLLPILAVYLCLQRYFIKSIDRVGIVG